MPPKRKTSPEPNTGATIASPSKTTKIFSQPLSASGDATEVVKPARKSQVPRTRFSDPSTLSAKPIWRYLCTRSKIYDGDAKTDLPEVKSTLDDANDPSNPVLPVSREGIEITMKLFQEFAKRDQDSWNVYVSNDFTGYGVSEVMENLLIDFNRDLYTKDVSPYRKWAYLEGLACYLKVGRSLDDWMMNDNSPITADIIDTFGTMILTCFEMLSESDLFSPNSDVKNIHHIALLILEFLDYPKEMSYEVGWGCEVVRICDGEGISLSQADMEQIDVEEKKVGLEQLRAEYNKKHQSGKYQHWAQKEDWQPLHDGNAYKYGKKLEAESLGWSSKSALYAGLEPRKWFRWDWQLEFKAFKKLHPGGRQYDLTKKSKRELKEYSYDD